VGETKIFKCEFCGNTIELLSEGGGQLVCCGQPIKQLEANSTDAAQEKHVPVIEKIDGGYKVSVGSAPHPMEDKHHIAWIELTGDCGISQRKFLKPGEAAVAEFKCGCGKVAAREMCNLHGLWKAAN
jgi:superoxide reductase